MRMHEKIKLTYFVKGKINMQLKKNLKKYNSKGLLAVFLFEIYVP